MAMVSIKGVLTEDGKIEVELLMVGKLVKSVSKFK